MNVFDLAMSRNSKKAFLVDSSRYGDTHLDKRFRTASPCRKLYNNSSPLSIRPTCLFVSVFNCTAHAPAFCYRFSDLICLRLDLAHCSHPPCVRALELGEREREEIFKSRAIHGGSLLIRLLILQVFTFAVLAFYRSGGFTRFRGLFVLEEEPELVFLLLLFLPSACLF